MSGIKGRSGRKPKEADQQMIEALSIYQNDVYRVLHENILKGEHWAIKIWFERMYGKPTEQRDLTDTSNDPPPLFNLINFTTIEE